MKKLLLIVLGIVAVINSKAQQKVNLTLQEVITMATEQSLDAFRAKNMYLSSYWNYKSSQAQWLPSVNLQLNPVEFNRTTVKRYDYEKNIEEYREQQTLSNYGRLAVTQNLAFTGGKVFIDTDLSRLQNFGTEETTTFSSTWLRLTIYDSNDPQQAVSIAIGLFASLLVSITLLPVYYKLFHFKASGRNVQFIEKINRINYQAAYEKGFRWVMRRQGIALGMFFLMLVFAALLYTQLSLGRLPELEKNTTLLHIDWNERLTLEENQRRSELLLKTLESDIQNHTLFLGQQQFLLNQENSNSASEATFFIQVKSQEILDKAKKEIEKTFARTFPKAVYEFEDDDNIFNKVFAKDKAPLVAKLKEQGELGDNYIPYLKKNLSEISKALPQLDLPSPNYREVMVLKADPVQLALYGVDYSKLYQVLQAKLNARQIYSISSSNYSLPVIVGEKEKSIGEIIEQTMVQNSKGLEIPIRNLLTQQTDVDLKEVLAGKGGEFYRIPFAVEGDEVEDVVNAVSKVVKGRSNFDVSFEGSYFSNQELMKKLLFILLLSVALLYFILAAQFESLSLPLIVLFEIPIDLFGAFLFLKLFGASLNLMSMIGIIVMSGIIINDSILKIDTINKLRQQGYPLMKALMVAGQRRLKPILMTSLTTILALLPILFTSGMGAELQKPLALSIIGGMGIGTLVSLYFIPLLYYYLVKK